MQKNGTKLQTDKNKGTRTALSDFLLAGFTLIELVITLSIFSIISAFALANIPSFSGDLLSERTAQEIALSFREAEGLSLGVAEFDESFPAFGVYFDSSSSNSYIMFADLDGNDLFSSDEEKVDEFLLSSKVKISDLCAGLKSSSPDRCNLDRIDITFERPVPSITIRGADGSFVDNFSDGEIIIESLEGESKTISVWITGQISVE